MAEHIAQYWCYHHPHNLIKRKLTRSAVLRRSNADLSLVAICMKICASIHAENPHCHWRSLGVRKLPLDTRSRSRSGGSTSQTSRLLIHSGINKYKYLDLLDTTNLVHFQKENQSSSSRSTSGPNELGGTHLDLVDISLPQVHSWDIKMLSEYAQSKKRTRSSSNLGREKLESLRRKNRGPLLTSLLEKTYVNLKNNKLLKAEECNYNAINSADCYEAQLNTPADSDLVQESKAKPVEKNSQYIDSRFSSLSKCTAEEKERFRKNLHNKYAVPSVAEVEKLSNMYHEPEELAHRVSSLLVEAEMMPSLEPLVTSHLGGFYWKARLTLPWPEKLTATSRNPNKDLAVKGAYLMFCDGLKSMGLIYRTRDGRWHPVNCEKVLAMLDQLTKYGDVIIGSSRGRGFKIILERCKESRPPRASMFGLCSPVSAHMIDVSNNRDSSKQGENGANDRNTASSCTVRSNTPVTSDIANMLRNPGSESRKLKWMCTIHVGWPIPFSVQAEGVSLPSAQRLAHMAVASKFKLVPLRILSEEVNKEAITNLEEIGKAGTGYDVKGSTLWTLVPLALKYRIPQLLRFQKLLTQSNSEMCSVHLEHFAMCETMKQWEQSITATGSKKDKARLEVDAEIFSDASMTGFGAYLLIKDLKKVSWLSECWDNHGLSCYHVSGDLNHLRSTLAELFALVSSVFSWKRKLRTRQLLVFSDNKTVISLVNTYSNMPLSTDNCQDHYDLLIRVLQWTCHEYNIKISAAWLQRQQNRLADCLSRQDSRTFKHAIPGAALHKTKAKKFWIHGAKFWTEQKQREPQV